MPNNLSALKLRCSYNPRQVKLPRTRRRPGYFGNTYFAEDELIELYGLMSKVILNIDIAYECREKDPTESIHKTKVAYAYMRKTPLIMENISLYLDRRSNWCVDPASLHSTRKLLQGFCPGQPETSDSPYLTFFTNLFEKDTDVIEDKKNERATWLDQYIAMLRCYDSLIRDCVKHKAIKNQYHFALSESFVTECYELHKKYYDGYGRMAYPQVHPRPGVIEINGKDIIVEVLSHYEFI